MLAWLGAIPLGMLPLGAPLYALGAGGVLFEESTGLGRRRNLSVSVNFSEDIRFPLAYPLFSSIGGKCSKRMIKSPVSSAELTLLLPDHDAECGACHVLLMESHFSQLLSWR